MARRPRDLVRYLDMRPGWRAFIDPFILNIWNNPERLAFHMHRITGVITAFFIFFHIISTSAPARSGWEAWLEEVANLDGITPISILFYIAMGAVLFHGLNGVRLLLVEALALGIGRPEKPKPPYIAPSLRGFQRRLIHIVFALWIILWIALGYVLFLT
ncbi:succinate dehydrogenase, cytochrome b556 subunit [Aeropyrum pernix]|nr:succinate dehydrogenase, cytochrome b556 subunit [Aeropyrum pernix]GBF08972.1 succinate dehydrogenase subunit C [Aeropyrum pernix]